METVAKESEGHCAAEGEPDELMSQSTVQIAAAVLGVILIVIVILRRKSKKKQQQQDEF